MGYGQILTKGAHLGERKMAARLGEGVGEWKSHQKGALGGGKITQVLYLERGVRFKVKG
jgi:hypothetical protein